MFPPAFFNILKEPLVVQKRMIPQKKALILSFFGAGKFEGAVSLTLDPKSIF